MSPLAGLVLTAIATCALLFAEWRESSVGVWIAKPLASAGFVAFGFMLAGADHTAYAGALLAALVACAVGDVLLIPMHPRAFQLGVACFAFGHLLYGWAFWGRGGHSFTWLHGVLIGMAPLVWRWLAPHVPRQLKLALIGYLCIITGMVSVAIATHDPRVVVGALMFWLSDLSVARDRLVAPAFVNRAWGLPLYFAAQLVLASSIVPLSEAESHAGSALSHP